MIVRSCIDPFSGEAVDDVEAVSGSNVYFPIIFEDDKRSFITVEHVADPDIKSLMLNIMLETGALAKPIKSIERVYDIATEAIEKTLDSLLSESVEYEIAESEYSGVCLTISIPDYSAAPALQTETLAKKILEGILMIVVKCRKCGYLVKMDEHKICPECGGEIETVD